METERSFSFTLDARRSVSETVEDLTFPQQDSEMIFETLKQRLRVVPFSDYLKRYVYLKSGMFGSFREVPLSAYQATIVGAFQETGTPSSFQRTKSKLQTRVHDWLQQITVRRNVVLLLGFGLSMSAEDVDFMLMNAIHDRRLDPEEPQEAICVYCYDHHYGYSKMEQLWHIYQSTEPGRLDLSTVEAYHPAGREASRYVIEEDYDLLRRLMPRKEYGGLTALKSRTRYHFERLYTQVCALIGDQMAKSYGHTGQVAPHDVEDVLCTPIPRDRHGNLVPDLRAEVRAWLAGKRFSRQHLHLLLHHETEPTRYDLITLRFLVSAMCADQYGDARPLYNSYLEDMNHILRDCGFGEMYAADPYESFLLMCLLSEEPLATYSEVLEMAYAENNLGMQAEEKQETT